MQIIDEKVYEDHFLEVTISSRDWEHLKKEGQVKQKLLCNGEIISFALILDFDRSQIVDQENRQEKKSRYR